MFQNFKPERPDQGPHGYIYIFPSNQVGVELELHPPPKLFFNRAAATQSSKWDCTIPPLVRATSCPMRVLLTGSNDRYSSSGHIL